MMAFEKMQSTLQASTSGKVWYLGKVWFGSTRKLSLSPWRLESFPADSNPVEKFPSCPLMTREGLIWFYSENFLVSLQTQILFCWLPSGEKQLCLLSLDGSGKFDLVLLGKLPCLPPWRLESFPADCRPSKNSPAAVPWWLKRVWFGSTRITASPFTDDLNNHLFTTIVGAPEKTARRWLKFLGYFPGVHK